MNYDIALTLDNILQMLFHHKKKFVACVLLGLAVAAAGILFLPRKYVSDAKLFVRVGRESVALDPTATTGDTIPVVNSREVELNTVLAVLRSRVLVENVVEKLGVDVILPNRDSSAGAWIASLFSSLDPVPDRERAVRQLESRYQATAERNSDIITVSCRAASPALAQRIVATFVDEYLEQHVRLHRTPDSHTFFAEQAALLQQQANAAVEELRDARNRAGLLTIDGQERLLHDQLTAVETALLRTEPLRAASEQKIATLQDSLSRLPERITISEVAGHPNVAADLMRSQLYDLEKRTAELAANFVAEYPPLAAARQQVTSLTAILAEQEPKRTQVTTGVNPTRQQLEKDLLAEQATAKALRAEVETLAGQQMQMKERFAALNDREAHIRELEQKVDLLQTHHRKYAEKLEQSRIDKALASERITNVNIMQPASSIATPASPQKPLLLALGLSAGLLLGFVAASTGERRARRSSPADAGPRERSPSAPAAGAAPPRRRALPEPAGVEG